MTLEEIILDSLKAVYMTFSGLTKFFRSRNCRKIVEGFLEQFKKLLKQMDSIPPREMQSFLNLLNSIVQTINLVLASNLCH